MAKYGVLAGRPLNSGLRLGDFTLAASAAGEPHHHVQLHFQINTDHVTRQVDRRPLMAAN